MLFPAPDPQIRPIAPELREQAQEIEKRSPGLYVLAARAFRYPVQQQAVRVQAERFHTLNLLEKFVLRAFAEIQPIPSLVELAGALGLDALFIKSTFNDLVSLENITKTFHITEEGRKSLNSERVTEAMVAETWYLQQDPILDNASFFTHPLPHIDSNTYEDISPYIQKDLTQVPPFVFQPDTHLLQEMGLALHAPEDGRIVTVIEPVGEPERCWKRIAVFVQHDTLSESTDQSITLHVRFIDQDQSLPIVADWLQEQLQRHQLSLKTLCGLEDDIFAREEQLAPGESVEEREVEERLEAIRQQAAEQLRLQKRGQPLVKEVGTAVQLRDEEIRPAFIEALRGAREQIIIYSPWINEQVVDHEFITLLEELVQKGIHILIGYGIGHREQQEDRPIPPQLQERLRAIQMAEGTSGVVVEWLGNSHAKEIIIDGRVHFNGSHNWLSYRGDRFPRGETVYKVTIAAQVKKAYEYQAGRFMRRAHSLWKRATVEEWQIALCILCNLNREQEAVDWLQREKRYHLIPFWLRLARQSMAAGYEERILTPLQTIITLCASTIQEGALKMEILDILRTLLKSLQLKNRQLAASFFRDSEAVLLQSGLLPL